MKHSIRIESKSEQNGEKAKEQPETKRSTPTTLLYACCERKNIPLQCRGFCKIRKTTGRSVLHGDCIEYVDDIKECITSIMNIKRSSAQNNISKVYQQSLLIFYTNNYNYNITTRVFHLMDCHSNVS